ncbi:MAG: YkgJ family cysteine cluster protein [Bacteroidales bacterium]|jgi:Fe-S-cluster containining protein|nr:YkgJ family cysteine cluster protein [Bacteroidales bacterium]
MSLLQQLQQQQQKSCAEVLAKLKKLKQKTPKNFDETIHKLHEEFFARIDCLECACCCKTLGPGVKDVDITRLAKHLKLRPAQLVERYFILDSDGDYMFRQSPCPFLLPDNYCSVYEARPKACREYPHSDRRRQEQLLSLHAKNCKTCPIIFGIFKELKTES